MATPQHGVPLCHHSYLVSCNNKDFSGTPEGNQLTYITGNSETFSTYIPHTF
jgi:hypothetical protein